MRRAGFVIVAIFLLKEELNSSRILHIAVRQNQGIHTSGWNAVRIGLVVGLGGVLGGVLVIGLVVGSVVGLIFGGAAYLQHYTLRWLLARQHALPWRAVPFFEEMTNSILLQRVGGGYRFVHPLLQDYFASLPLPRYRK